MSSLQIGLLGELCSFVNGGTPSKSVERYFQGNIPWITGADITGPLVNTARGFITEEAIKNSATNLVPAGTVLLVTRTSVGKVAIAGVSLCFSQDITAIFPDAEKLDAKYLVHFLKSQEAYFEQRRRGATIQGVTREVLARLAIPLPPLPDQRCIAAILDKADALRAKRRQAIAKLDALLKSVFIEMFGDPVTNPKGWPVGTIDMVVGEKSDVRCGPFGTQLKVDELVDSGVPLFGIENVHNNKFVPSTKKFLTQSKAAELSAFSIRSGDVLVTRMGTIGRACVVPHGFNDGRISYHLFRVRPDKNKCLPEFLASTICRSGTFQAQLRTLSHGAIMAGLSTGDLRTVKFLVPPLFFQEKYVNAVTTVEKLIAKQEEGFSKLEILFQSLQHRAFSGELFTERAVSVPHLVEVSQHG